MRMSKASAVVVPTTAAAGGATEHAFGVFTERDFVRLLAEGDGALAWSAPAVEHVSSDLLWVEPSLGLFDALAQLHEREMAALAIVAAIEEAAGGSCGPPSVPAVLSMSDMLGCAVSSST
jgi:hypothetical protein